MRHVGLAAEPETAGHWQEGTNDNVMSWDSIDSTKDTGRKLHEVENVYINEK